MGRKAPRTWPDTPVALAGPVMDNHTHLPLREEEIPRADGVRLPLDTQLERATEVGVTRVVTSACSTPDFDAALDLARTHIGIRVALAIHPNEAALHAGCTSPSPDGLVPERLEHHVPLIEALEQVACRLADPMVVAVGESGLDHYRTAEDGWEAQAESFRAHLEMARLHDLPLQIHDRDAHADTLEILQDSATGDQPIVFHCFSGDAEMARVLRSHDWYTSFAGPLTYPANQRLRDALAEMPRELVLVETDAPYLTPVPWRGSPNASYVMAHTVRAIAAAWGIDERDACAQLMRNSHRVYGAW